MVGYASPFNPVRGSASGDELIYMNQKTAKKLRKLCVMTSVDAGSTRSRYQKLKKGWNKTSSNHRHNLYVVLLKKSKVIEEEILKKKNSA